MENGNFYVTSRTRKSREKGKVESVKCLIPYTTGHTQKGIHTSTTFLVSRASFVFFAGAFCSSSTL